MRKFINILILVVALVGSVSAQSTGDISKRIYDLSIEAINKGMNAYEEQLFQQELEAAKKAEEYEEQLFKQVLEAAKKAEEEEALEAKRAEESKFGVNCNVLANSAILYPAEHDAWMICYCDPVGDYIWYTICCGADSNWWIKLAYDNNGEVGDVFYATIFRDFDFIKVKDDISGKETAAIKLINAVGYIVVIQDIYEPRAFTINW